MPHQTPGFDQRIDLTRRVFAILDAWQVTPADQITLLGLGDQVRPRMMSRYRSGTPLPEDKEVMMRVLHLISIETALHTAFPHSISIANLWITTPIPRFSNRTPLEIMLSGGAAGIERVLYSLDNTGSW